jgi:hypothetical protein
VVRTLLLTALASVCGSLLSRRWALLLLLLLAVLLLALLLLVLLLLLLLAAAVRSSRLSASRLSFGF